MEPITDSPYLDLAEKMLNEIDQHKLRIAVLEQRVDDLVAGRAEPEPKTQTDIDNEALAAFKRMPNGEQVAYVRALPTAEWPKWQPHVPELLWAEVTRQSTKPLTDGTIRVREGVTDTEAEKPRNL